MKMRPRPTEANPSRVAPESVGVNRVANSKVVVCGDGASPPK